MHRALVESGIFARTDPDTVSALSAQLRLERIPAGLIMNAQNDFHGRLYVLISGKVQLSYVREDAGEFTLTVLAPPQIFGAKTLFDPDSSDYRITTLSEVSAVPIERDLLLAWIGEHPEIADQLLRLFARYAKAMTSRMVEFAFADAPSRIANRLLILRQQFGRREGDGVRVAHDLTLEDIAIFVDASPEIVVAALGDFEERGWIRVQGNSIVIYDAQGLKSARQRDLPNACPP